MAKLERIMTNNLLHPNMRQEFVDHLKVLSGQEYQVNSWINKTFSWINNCDEFDIIVHFLFDDTNLSRSPYSLIEIFLYNDEKAETSNVLCKHIDNLLTKYDLEHEGSYCCKLPEWDHVISTSKKNY